MTARPLLCLPLLLFGCAPSPRPEPAASPTHDAAVAIVRKHLAQYDGLDFLELHVERVSTAGGKSKSERWTFRQKGHDRFRIDYTYPRKRIMVGTTSDLWEYLPDDKAAMRTDLSAFGPNGERRVLQIALSRVAVNGLRFSVQLPDDLAKPHVRLALVGERTVAGRPCHCIEVTDMADATRGLRGWIDKERLALLRSEFLVTGSVVARMEAEDVRRVAPDLWLPYRLSFHALDSTEAAQKVTFTRIQANGPMDDSVFAFEPPPGTKLVRP